MISYDDVLQQAAEHAASGNDEQALALLTRVPSGALEGPEATLMIAHLHRRAGRMDQAFAAAAKVDPDTAEAVEAAHLLGGLCLDSGRNAEAVVYSTHALDAGPRRGVAVNCLCNRAMALARLGREQDALDDLDAALALEPHAALALDERARLFVVLGRLDEAERDLDRLLEVRPEDLEVLGRRARVHMLLGDAQAADRDLSAILAVDPDWRGGQAFRWRGLCRVALADPHAGVADFSAGIERGSELCDNLLNRAEALLELDEAVGARAHLELALEVATAEWEHSAYTTELLARLRLAMLGLQSG